MRALVTTAAAALLLAACGQGDRGDNNAVAAPERAGADDAKDAQGRLAGVLGGDPRFAALLAAAGMTPVLEGKEPYTVLAPTRQALDALPPGSIERLSQPAARVELTGLLRRHILPGTILAEDLAKAVAAGGGKATVASLAGEPLIVTRDGDGFRIADSAGKGARIAGKQRLASNGVIHEIDAILPAPAATKSEAN